MTAHPYVGHLRWELVGAYLGHPLYVKAGVYGYTFQHGEFHDGYVSYQAAFDALKAEVDSYYLVNF